MRTFLAAAAAVLLLTACGGPAGELEPEAPVATPTPTATAFPTMSPTPYAGAVATGEYAGLELTADGLGPIRLGMTVAEGQARGWVARLEHCRRWGSSPALLAEGVDLVFDGPEETAGLAEIWVGNPVHPTAEGARVGMPMEEVAYFYRERLQFEPRGSVGGSMEVPFVRSGDHELAFYALGDENEIPGPRSPVSAIGARAYGGDILRPSC